MATAAAAGSSDKQNAAHSTGASAAAVAAFTTLTALESDLKAKETKLEELSSKLDGLAKQQLDALKAKEQDIAQALDKQIARVEKDKDAVQRDKERVQKKIDALEADVRAARSPGVGAHGVAAHGVYGPASHWPISMALSPKPLRDMPLPLVTFNVVDPAAQPIVTHHTSADAKSPAPAPAPVPRPGLQPQPNPLQPELQGFAQVMSRHVVWLATPSASATEEPSKRNEFWLLLRGPAGAGKTRAAREYAKALALALEQRGVAAFITASNVQTPPSRSAGELDADAGHRALTELFLVAHNAPDRHALPALTGSELHALLAWRANGLNALQHLPGNNNAAGGTAATAAAAPGTVRVVWLVLLDEAHTDVQLTRGILRAVERWNRQSVVERGVDLLIAPVVVLPSDHALVPRSGSVADDLRDPTRFVRHTLNVAFLPYQHTKALIAAAYRRPPQRIPSGELIGWYLQFGGWPCAFEFLHAVLPVATDTGGDAKGDAVKGTPEPVLTSALAKCRDNLQGRYWASVYDRFHSDNVVRRLLLLALSGMFVPLQLRLNGHTIEHAQQFGIFRAQTATELLGAMARLWQSEAGDRFGWSDADASALKATAAAAGDAVCITMPVAVARFLASRLHGGVLIPPSLQLATFVGTGWVDFELLSCWSLALRLSCAADVASAATAAVSGADGSTGAGALCARTSASVASIPLGTLRNGADLAPAMKALRVVLPPGDSHVVLNPGVLPVLRDKFDLSAFPLSPSGVPLTSSSAGSFAGLAVAANASASGGVESPAKPMVSNQLSPAVLAHGCAVLCAPNQHLLDYMCLLPVVSLDGVDAGLIATPTRAAGVKPVRLAFDAKTAAPATAAAGAGAGAAAPVASGSAAGAILVPAGAKAFLLLCGQSKSRESKDAPRPASGAAASAGQLTHNALSELSAKPLEKGLWSAIDVAVKPLAQTFADFYGVPVCPLVEVFATKFHRQKWREVRAQNWAAVCYDEVAFVLGPILSACLGPAL